MESPVKLPGTPPSSPPPKPRKKLLTVVAVLLVMAVLASGAFIWVVAPPITFSHSPSLKAAILSDSQVSSLAGKQLNEHASNATSISSLSSETPINMTMAYFNASASNRTVVIGSFEFASSSSAHSFFMDVYHNLSLEMRSSNASSSDAANVSFTIVNATYSTFNYTTFSISFMNVSLSIAVGFSGHFTFIVGEIDFPASVVNFTTLVHEEISAMSG